MIPQDAPRTPPLEKRLGDPLGDPFGTLWVCLLGSSFIIRASFFRSELTLGCGMLLGLFLVDIGCGVMAWASSPTGALGQRTMLPHMA